MREFELQNLKALRSVPLICIKITSSSGKESNLTVSLRDTVNTVKDKALGGEYSKESPFYRLILAKSNRELIDQKTLEEENVQDDGKCFISSCPISFSLSYKCIIAIIHSKCCFSRFQTN